MDKETRSIDGDNPAAMRYTEARLRKVAEDMLSDLDKETVDFRPNFDEPEGTHRFACQDSKPSCQRRSRNCGRHGHQHASPQLDGSGGGMVHLVDNPDCTIEDLMTFVKAPDFPTGG